MEEQPPSQAEPNEKQPACTPAESVGRNLGKLFGKVTRTKLWKDTSQAYQAGKEGKEEK